MWFLGTTVVVLVGVDAVGIVVVVFVVDDVDDDGLVRPFAVVLLSVVSETG